MDALGNPRRTKQTARKSTGGCIARLKREPQLQEVEQLATTTTEPATLFSDLPAELVQQIVVRLSLAHNIARAAPTCKVVSVAVRNAFKVRPFSGEVVTLAVAVAGDASSGGLAVTPDGCIITGSWDGFVRVWRDGACELTIQAAIPHAPYIEGTIESLVVLPGGARFVTTSDDGTARLWTLDGTLVRTFGPFGIGEEYAIVNHVAALPDGVHFVVGTGGDTPYPHPNEVRLYHVDGTLVHTFRGHTAAVWAVAVTPDGQHIISGSYDKLVKVWSVATKREVATCIGHAGEVFAVAPMPNSKRFLSGSADRTVRVWNLDDTSQNTFKLHNHMVRALVALPDNQHALSGSADNSVKLFNVKDGAVLRTFRHRTNDVRSLALLPDGLRFVHGSQDNTARIAYHGLAPTKA